MNLVQGFVHHPSKHLWKPEGNRSKHSDNGDREKRIVKMCHDKITVMEIYIHGTSTQINSCDPANQKGNQESKGPQHGSGEFDGTAI